jgi:hypothetical protein
MKSVRFLTLPVFIGLAIFSLSPVAYSQQGYFNSMSPIGIGQSRSQSYLDLTAGFRKYFNSFTSWQVPDMGGGPQDPISRLEYPWDQTFLAIIARAAYTGLEVNMEWSGTMSVLSGPKAQDSDWEDPNVPGQKTTFSEANANPRCWILDISGNAGIPGLSYLRGVAGYRTSQFKFTNSDGYQYSIYNPDLRQYLNSSIPLPGAIIEFSQFYQHVYGGGIVDGFLNFGGTINGLSLPTIMVRIQADGSYVTGSGNDQHLQADKTALLRSSGFGWHVNLTTGFRTGRYGLYADGDIRAIHTNGGLDGAIDGNGLSRGGAKVWSEQKYVGIYGTIFF